MTRRTVGLVFMTLAAVLHIAALFSMIALGYIVSKTVIFTTLGDDYIEPIRAVGTLALIVGAIYFVIGEIENLVFRGKGK